MKPIIRRFDAVVVGWVRHIPRSWDRFFLVTTYLGDPFLVIGLAVAVGLWGLLQGATSLIISACAVPTTLVIGSLLKRLFERARPMGDFSHILWLDTFSFPSGHASGSTVMYGLLAIVAWEVVAAPYSVAFVLLLCLAVIVVGISRVYLSVHHPSDVLVGWLLGASALCVIIFLVSPF